MVQLVLWPFHVPPWKLVFPSSFAGAWEKQNANHLQNHWQPVISLIRSACHVPGSAVVHVKSFGSWNCVGFLCMAAAIRRSKGLLRVVGVLESSVSEPCASSSTSSKSSSMSFCSDSVGVSVEEVLELGVAGRLLGRLSKSRTWATAARSPMLPDPTVGSKRSVPHSCSGAGDGNCFNCRSRRPFICSFFCSLFYKRVKFKN